jgi:hypothetical protein
MLKTFFSKQVSNFKKIHQCVRLPTFTLIIKQTVIDHFSQGFFVTNLLVKRISSICKNNTVK